MKIEKLNENKIKITFSSEYLKNNNISVHSFMSKSLESQALFSTLLDEAEKEVGFNTDNYKIFIEALTQNKDNFTLIISRFLETPYRSVKPRLRVSRKLSILKNNISLYKFDNIENFFDFSEYILKNNDISSFLENKNSLYKYENSYFLSIDKIFLEKKLLFKITSILSEFSIFVNISPSSFQKLKEFGQLLANNAIYVCAQKK